MLTDVAASRSAPDVLGGGQRARGAKNNAIITKLASGTAKIDPLMAAFNAIALMSTNLWSAQPSMFVI